MALAPSKMKQPDLPAVGSNCWNNFWDKLFLRDSQLVVAHRGQVDFVWQLELGIHANVGIFWRDIFADKVFQRHARHRETVNTYFTDADFTLPTVAGRVSVNPHIMPAA